MNQQSVDHFVFAGMVLNLDCDISTFLFAFSYAIKHVAV